ncbi:conserved protein of unknown function [Tenacibaculum sp. 190130A14a]|uniref:Glycine dehydrogenase n=1 Tax=Tenacibaculum polynesiense TaxID=3137857 RepID=A0ABP1F2V5_9FLAO
MFRKFLITCDEATTICDKSQYGEATFLEKIKLNFHLLVCKVCAMYTKQNRTMSKLFKMKASNCSKQETQCLSNSDKEALKEQLKQFKL